MQKFVTIRSGVSFPRMRDFARQIAHPKGVSFLGFLQLATAKARGRILTQNRPTPKLAVLRKNVPFRGREHKI